VLVLVVVLVLDFDRYWLGEPKAQLNEASARDRTCLTIKKIDNEHEDEHEHD
jgi:hypothetical protein